MLAGTSRSTPPHVWTTTCSVAPRPSRSLSWEPWIPVGQSRVGCRAVSRLPLVARGSPHDSRPEAVFVVPTVPRHLGCQSLALPHRSEARRDRARVPSDASSALAYGSGARLQPPHVCASIGPARFPPPAWQVAFFEPRDTSMTVPPWLRCRVGSAASSPVEVLERMRPPPHGVRNL